MAYTVDQIKILAYNCEEKEDFTDTEFNLFLGLAYAYEWYRANPEDRSACMELMQNYIDFYANGSPCPWKRAERPSWLERKQSEEKGSDS